MKEYFGSVVDIISQGPAAGDLLLVLHELNVAVDKSFGSFSAARGKLKTNLRNAYAGALMFQLFRRSLPHAQELAPEHRRPQIFCPGNEHWVSQLKQVLGHNMNGSAVHKMFQSC